jgi:hypothetical protein
MLFIFVFGYKMVVMYLCGSAPSIFLDEFATAAPLFEQKLRLSRGQPGLDRQQSPQTLNIYLPKPLSLADWFILM